ncbi:unnamed protein product [Spirodela intermedia]|uniref:Uncharacterized protein n=1 Tax=Spirodela intermedia TaxID=51605 RepID=A0A7I8IL85_SPIIN|nr:unnamed protein product [Spirodela intermedia]CAA6657698.1 unnamed protein product [Spirodela intermedia]
MISAGLLHPGGAAIRKEGSVTGGGSRRVGRMVTAPFRALRRLRDLYVRSMTGCAGSGNFRKVTAFPGGASAGIRRSYSLNPSRVSSSSEDDLRDLVRAASQVTRWQATVPRSQSVAIGRIDEDKPSDFTAEPVLGPLYPGAAAALSQEEGG